MENNLVSGPQDCMVQESLNQSPVKGGVGLRVSRVPDQVGERIRLMQAAGDHLHQLVLFRCQGIRLGSEVVTFLREKRRFQVAPRHDGRQGLPPLHVLFQPLVELVDPAQVFLVRFSPDTFEQRVQHSLLCKDQLVHHGRKGGLQIALPDGFHAAGAYVVQVLLADPNRILQASGRIHMPL